MLRHSLARRTAATATRAQRCVKTARVVTARVVANLSVSAAEPPALELAGGIMKWLQCLLAFVTVFSLASSSMAQGRCEKVQFLDKLGYGSGHKGKFCRGKGYEGNITDPGKNGWCYSGDVEACRADAQAGRIHTSDPQPQTNALPTGNYFVSAYFTCVKDQPQMSTHGQTSGSAQIQITSRVSCADALSLVQQAVSGRHGDPCRYDANGGSTDSDRWNGEVSCNQAGVCAGSCLPSRR